MTQGADPLPDGIDALRAALMAERIARHEAEARATGAEAMIAHLKLLISKLQRDRFGPTSERSLRLLDQLELQLEELEADSAEAEAKRPEPAAETSRRGPRAKRFVVRCRRICRASASLSRARSTARAARASCPSSARRSPKRSR